MHVQASSPGEENLRRSRVSCSPCQPGLLPLWYAMPTEQGSRFWQQQPPGVCLCIQASACSARSSQGVVLVPSLKQREGGTDGM